MPLESLMSLTSKTFGELNSPTPSDYENVSGATGEALESKMTKVEFLLPLPWRCHKFHPLPEVIVACDASTW